MFDPSKVTYKTLIRKYVTRFKPRRVFTDDKSQYRAAIFYHDEKQKKEASEVLSELGIDKKSHDALLEPAKKFYPAEEYHQNYYDKMSLRVHR